MPQDADIAYFAQSPGEPKITNTITEIISMVTLFGAYQYVTCLG